MTLQFALPPLASRSASAAGARFAQWREEFALKFAQVDAATPDPDAFAATVSLVELPRLILSRYEVGALDLIRTRRLVNAGEDGCSVVICLSGSVDTRFADADFHLAPGEAALVPHHIAGTVSSRCGTQSLHLRFDPDGARALSPARDLIPRKVSRDNPALGMLAFYGQQVIGADGPLPPNFASLASAQLRELSAHVLNPGCDMARSAGYGGLKAARLRAVLGLITANLGDLGLSAAGVGARLGLSARYVQQLMEGLGVTFAQHVRRARLDEARRLLTDPASAHLKITDIVFAVGFQDVSYFNREFRRRFGDTPSGVRRTR